MRCTCKRQYINTCCGNANWAVPFLGSRTLPTCQISPTNARRQSQRSGVWKTLPCDFRVMHIAFKWASDAFVHKRIVEGGTIRVEGSGDSTTYKDLNIVFNTCDFLLLKFATVNVASLNPHLPRISNTHCKKIPSIYQNSTVAQGANQAIGNFWYQNESNIPIHTYSTSVVGFVHVLLCHVLRKSRLKFATFSINPIVPARWVKG